MLGATGDVHRREWEGKEPWQTVIHGTEDDDFGTKAVIHDAEGDDLGPSPLGLLPLPQSP